MVGPVIKTRARRFAWGKKRHFYKPFKAVRAMNNKRELSYREICRIMGRNLRIINPPEPEQEQLELFEAQQ